MARRIRSIKPAFWESEKVAKRLSGADGRQARLLFIAIWSLAEDATGVARGNAAYVRSEAFPYDDDITTKDVDRWLGLLERGRFIVRFEREDQTYLWVRGFKEHQKIDRPSKPSLPEPTPEEIEHALSQSSGGIAYPSRDTREDSDEARDNSASPREDSGKKHVGGGGGGGGGDGEMEVEVEGGPLREDLALSADADPRPVPSTLQDCWNKTAHPSLPRWKETPRPREKRARQALKDRGMLSWAAVIQRINASSFCRGENDRGWKADPDWLLQPGVATRVLEGKYDDRDTGPPQASVNVCATCGDGATCKGWDGNWTCYPCLASRTAELAEGGDPNAQMALGQNLKKPETEARDG